MLDEYKGDALQWPPTGKPFESIGSILDFPREAYAAARQPEGTNKHR